MATTTQKAEILLGLNVAGLKKGFTNGAAAAKKFGDRMQANRQSFKKTAMVSGAMFAGMMLWMNKVTKAAGVQEAAETKLRDTLVNVTGTTEENTQALIDQAAALQQVTKFGDEQTIAGQAMLGTFQLTAEQIKKVTPRMLDMAAAQEKLTGQSVDLNVIAQALGKGFTGQIGLLSRYGVQLTDVEKKTMSFENLLGFLDKRFKGLAEGSAKTFLGRKQQLSNVIGDLNEQIGFTLLPVLTDLMEKIKPLVIKTADWVAENQELVKWILGIGIGGTGLIFGLSTMGFLLAGLPMLIAAISGPIGWLILGVGALVGGIIAWKMATKEGKTALEEFNEEQKNTKTELDNVANKLKDNATETKTLTEKAEGYRKKIAEGKDVFGTYKRLLEDTKGELKDNARETETLTKKQKELLEVQKDLVVLDEINKLLRENAEEYEKLNLKLEENQKKLDSAGRGMGQAIGLHEDLARTARDETAAALELNRQEAVQLTEALEELNKTTKDSTNANKDNIETTKTKLQQLIDEKDALGILAYAQDLRKQKDAEQLELDGLVRGSLEETKDSIDGVGEGLLYVDGAWDIVKEKSDEVMLEMGEKASEWDLLTQGMGESMHRNLYGAVASTFLAIYETEKKFMLAFAQAWGLGLLNVMQNTIEMAVAELIVHKLKTVGALTISGFLNPFNWAKIAPALAAATAAIASLEALKGAVKPQPLSFERGLEVGPVPRTGYYQLHEGERVFNPRINAMEDLRAVAGVGGSGDIYLTPAFYGSINNRANINEISADLARQLAIARTG